MALFRAYQGRVRAIHDSKNKKAIRQLATRKGETALARRVARKFRVALKIVNEALLYVDVYRRRAGVRLGKAITEELKALHSGVESVFCGPVHDRMGITIKLRARAGWSKSSMKKTIKMDLLKALRIGRERAQIGVVTVWIVAPMQGGAVMKVASVKLDKAKQCTSKSCRITPWFAQNLR